MMREETREHGKETKEVDFSCFSTFRSESGGVRHGECAVDHNCIGCDAYNIFYEKAEEYQEAGNNWGMSVALVKRFFGIPTVPEYDVEAYEG